MDQTDITPTTANPHTPTRAEAKYWAEGSERAHSLKNRGPLRWDEAGQLHPEIREAYDRTGFYIFEQAIDAEELSEFDQDLAALLERAPSHEGSAIARSGKPSVGADGTPVFLWAQALQNRLSSVNLEIFTA